jgi:hypothetical protein
VEKRLVAEKASTIVLLPAQLCSNRCGTAKYLFTPAQCADYNEEREGPRLKKKKEKNRRLYV